MRSLAAAVLLLGLASAWAGPHHGSRASVQFTLDARYHHDVYYPRAGWAMDVLPAGSVSLHHGGHPWHYHGGVWYRPWGGRFVVGVPPFGIVVPLLPPAYVDLWIGGRPYYYANGVYYASAPGGYVVVEPPDGAETATPAPRQPRPPEPIVYPRNNQSAEQKELDRRDCERWATTQPSAVADASVFQRAVAACLDGRGYTVR